MAQEDMPVDAAKRAEIIDSVTSTLNRAYVFPDVAKEMEQHVRELLKKHEYDTISSTNQFTQKLSEDLRSVSNDKHLNVSYFDDEYIEGYMNDTLTDEEEKRRLRMMAYENHGFNKVERLPGNIGYVDFTAFEDAGIAGATAIAAMNFVSNCDAVIIDLRQNGGGSPSMIQLISSYFFDEPVHLNSFFFRENDTVHQFWTQSYVPGEKMTDVELYVLTSSRTFSAAEEFTYNMKNLERATIVGETTGGGAHPVEGRFFANLNVGMSVPFGRAVNPVTGTNWEGTGIEPHIVVPQDSALLYARLDALKKLKDKADDEELRDALNWDYDNFSALLSPKAVDESTLRTYAGVYGPRTVTLEDGILFYQREGRPKYKMIPMSDDTFMFEEIDYFRLKFVTDEDGNPTEVNGLYKGGYVDISVRSN